MKISDIYDELVWYAYYKPIQFYKALRGWWYCNGSNPYYWKHLAYCAFKADHWDAHFILESEYYWISKSLYFFKNKCNWISDEHRADIIKWQTIALNLLDIICERKEYWAFDNEKKCTICYKYVNRHNAHRFAARVPHFPIVNHTTWSTEAYKVDDFELYKAKAFNLYCRIIKEYSTYWWD